MARGRGGDTRRPTACGGARGGGDALSGRDARHGVQCNGLGAPEGRRRPGCAPRWGRAARATLASRNARPANVGADTRRQAVRGGCDPGGARRAGRDSKLEKSNQVTVQPFSPAIRLRAGWAASVDGAGRLRPGFGPRTSRVTRTLAPCSSSRDLAVTTPSRRAEWTGLSEDQAPTLSTPTIRPSR